MSEAETRPPKTDAELRELAIDIVDGRIFTSGHLRPHEEDMVRLIFMPLSLMSPEDLQRLKEQECALFYEHLHKAAPRSINGLPSFFSMAWLNKEETVRLNGLVKEFQATRDAFMVGETIDAKEG